jgi:NAD(P)-dependent dehydrogenase (short-subunit alcohol dehydrogenase family)
MKLLDSKICIVTGAAGSLGLATAELFLRDGAKVMLVDREAASLKAAADRLGHPDQVMVQTADVTDAKSTAGFIEATVARWGGLDVLFCNAGISGAICPVTDYPEEVFDRVMAVNVRGPFLGCKYALPKMRDGGSIIITSSVVGTTSDPGIAAYATSKHAVIGLMRTVAKEAAHRRIRVNVVAPGPIANDFQRNVETGLSRAIGRDAGKFLDGLIPLGRHGLPEEIGRLVLYLASDQSSFSTGGVFTADGGMSI